MRPTPTITLIAGLAGLLPLSTAFGLWYFLAGRPAVPRAALVGIAAGLAVLGVVLIAAVAAARSLERSSGPDPHPGPGPVGGSIERGVLERLGRALLSDRPDLRGSPLKRFLLFAAPRPPRKVPVAVNEAIEVCINAIRSGSPKAARPAEFAFDPDPNVGVARLDPDQFHQVLLNLILNARDAAGPGGHVDVRTQRLDDAVLIAVRDDGPGIDAAEIERMFEPFGSRKPRALGLGLATCRQIVEAHGGSMTVANVLPHGLEVGVTLPLGGRSVTD